MLLFYDGFDHYTGHVRDSGKWSASSVDYVEVTTTAYRTGGRALTAYYWNSEAVTQPLPAVGGFVLGIAIRPAVVATGTTDWLRIKEGSIQHLALALTAGNVLLVRMAGAVLKMGVTPLPVNSWTYVEFKGTIDDTNGSFEVRIDGATDIINDAPLDTRNGGVTGQWDRVAITNAMGVNNFNQVYYDDFYVCDQSGPVRNTFLGAVRVETLLAQTDAVAVGTNRGLTPSTGTDHGALVDEIPPNTTDFNSANVVGLKDTYNFPSLIGTGIILGVQPVLYVAKSDAGIRKVCAVLRVNGQDFDGKDKALLTSFGYVTDIWEQKPLSPPEDFVAADITAIEAGMKVTV